MVAKSFRQQLVSAPGRKWEVLRPCGRVGRRASWPQRLTGASPIPAVCALPRKQNGRRTEVAVGERQCLGVPLGPGPSLSLAPSRHRHCLHACHSPGPSCELPACFSPLWRPWKDFAIRKGGQQSRNDGRGCACPPLF